MEFIVKTPQGDPGGILTQTPEIIARQRVGTRLDFTSRHDLTVEFADGALMVDDIDQIIYVVPEEYFCYRGDDFILKFMLAGRRLVIDHRPLPGNVNPRAIITAER
jgi:hypothetical protein